MFDQEETGDNVFCLYSNLYLNYRPIYLEISTTL